MDLRAGRLPQPQLQQQPQSTASPSSNQFNGTEAIRTNEPNKFITFKDVYDYLSLDVLSGIGGSGSVNDADLLYPFSLTNYTLDGVLGSSSSVASALNQSTTIFQSSNGTAAWNSSALWLANGSMLAAGATNASIGLSDSVINGSGVDGGADIGGIIVTAATSIILGLMILITVIGEWRVRLIGGCVWVVAYRELVASTPTRLNSWWILIWYLTIVPPLRKCVCNCCDYTRAESAKCGQLLGGIASRCRFVRGMPGDATGRSLRGESHPESSLLHKSEVECEWKCTRRKKLKHGNYAN